MYKGSTSEQFVGCCQFGKVLYAKEAIENYGGSELLWTIVDYWVVMPTTEDPSPEVKWFKAYCEFVSVATEVLVNIEVN